MAMLNCVNSRRYVLHHGWWWRLAAFLLLTTGGGAVLAADHPTEGALAAQAGRNLEAARQKHAAEPTAPTAGWQLARACFDRAEFATNDTQRAALAKEGIAVSRQLLRQQPALAPAHYYLAKNLGQLARTKPVTVLSLVGEMERAFKRAQALDAAWDHAGPDRCLGLLYRDAPGWPVSLGSKSKARLHLERAMELSPAFPANRLSLIESMLQWDDGAGLAALFPGTAERLSQARTQFAGEDWAASWARWNQRWVAIQGQMSRLNPPAPKQEPRRSQP